MNKRRGKAERSIERPSRKNHEKRRATTNKGKQHPDDPLAITPTNRKPASPSRQSHSTKREEESTGRSMSKGPMESSPLEKGHHHNCDMTRGNQQAKARARRAQRNAFEILAQDEEETSPSPSPSPLPAPSTLPSSLTPHANNTIAAYFLRKTTSAGSSTQTRPLSYAQVALGAKRNNNEVETPSVTSSPLKKANTNTSPPADLDGDTTMREDEESSSFPAEENATRKEVPEPHENEPNEAREAFTAQEKGKSVARAPTTRSNAGRFEATPCTAAHALDSYSISPPNTPVNPKTAGVYRPSPFPVGPEYTHSRPPTEHIKHHYPRSRWPPDIEGSTFDPEFPLGNPATREETPPHADCTLFSGCGIPGFPRETGEHSRPRDSPPPFLHAPPASQGHPTAPQAHGSATPQTRSAFIDVDDDLEEEEEEAPTPADNAAGEPPIVYYDGPLPEHSISFTHIMESVEEGTEAAWRGIPGHKLLVFFANERPYDTWLARIEEIKREIKRVTGSNSGVEVSYTKVNGITSKRSYHDMIQPFLVHSLTRNQMEAMANKKMTVCSKSWIVWNLFEMPIPRYAFTIPHIPIRDTPETQAIVVGGVCETLRNSPVHVPLLDHISKYSNRYPEDFPTDPQRRVRAFLRSITASAITIKVRQQDDEMMWRFYLEPPHDDHAIHHSFIESLKTFVYTIRGQKYITYEDYRCLACRGRDHMKGLCPFRALPGFHDVRFGGPTTQPSTTIATTSTAAATNSTIQTNAVASSSLLDIGKRNPRDKALQMATPGLIEAGEGTKVVEAVAEGTRSCSERTVKKILLTYSPRLTSLPPVL
ncbi:hypothetical protein BKA70DRAFT_1226872 [Coprinopsis sp. MPI-PUGE-AT-0042]|nr:hypothetical protein BKA70DRAFT_1226872 [Coprinopsis sp. MPI-PUGE-AT-0042]